MLKPTRGLLIALAASLVPFALIAIGCGCGGADFEAGETEASIYVSDAATGEPIANPVFKRNGVELPVSCQEDPDMPDVCMAAMIVLAPAVHEIRVEAEGYKPQMLTVDTTGVPSVHLAVELEAGE